jgi:hypothetical protein
MEQSIKGYLGSLQLGEVQQFKNLAMVPVVSDLLMSWDTSRLRSSRRRLKRDSGSKRGRVGA